MVILKLFLVLLLSIQINDSISVMSAVYYWQYQSLVMTVVYNDYVSNDDIIVSGYWLSIENDCIQCSICWPSQYCHTVEVFRPLLFALRADLVILCSLGLTVSDSDTFITHLMTTYLQYICEPYLWPLIHCPTFYVSVTFIYCCHLSILNVLSAAIFSPEAVIYYCRNDWRMVTCGAMWKQWQYQSLDIDAANVRNDISIQ